MKRDLHYIQIPLQQVSKEKGLYSNQSVGSPDSQALIKLPDQNLIFQSYYVGSIETAEAGRTYAICQGLVHSFLCPKQLLKAKLVEVNCSVYVHNSQLSMQMQILIFVPCIFHIAYDIGRRKRNNICDWRAKIIRLYFALPCLVMSFIESM